MKKFLLTVGLCFVDAHVARAFDFSAASPTCLQFSTPVGPEHLPEDALTNISPLLETWCYWPGAEGDLLIFNMDDNRALPELSILVTPAGKTLTFGSRVKGELTMHRLRQTKINPMPVPLSLDQAYNIALNTGSVQKTDP